MDKRWLWGGIGFCLCWCLAAGVIGTIRFLLPQLPLVLGWMPQQPNTAYYISDWVSLLLWAPWVFMVFLFGYILPVFGKWLPFLAIACVAFAVKVYQRCPNRVITYCMVFGFLMGAFQFSMSAFSRGVDNNQQPSTAEKLLTYGVPAWIASTVSGLWVGWLWRVYPLRIRIELMQDSDNEVSNQ